MNLKQIYILIFIISLFSCAFAEEDKIVNIQADGLGFIINDDKNLARDRALEDARRRALEDALGTFIESESIVQNYQMLDEKIYSKTQGFLKNEKILKEEYNNEIYKITILVDVGVSKLEQDLSAINLALKRKQWPRIMVLVQENIIDVKIDPLKSNTYGNAETAIIKKLKEKNFILVERNNIAGGVYPDFSENFDTSLIKKINQNARAEILILGIASASSGGSIMNTMMKSLQANISARAVKADTGEIIYSASANSAKPHINEKIGGILAVQDAAGKLSDDLIAGIINKLNQEINSTSKVTVILNGVEYGDIKKIVSILKIQVVATLSQEIIQRNFENDIAILEADVRGSTQNFADELITKKFFGFQFKVKSVSSNKLELVVVKN